MRVLAIVTTLGMTVASWANVYTVKNVNDSGKNSLRWAINSANAHSGPDRILFRPGLAGKAIRPLTELPALTDDGTQIIGDIDRDGAPDIALRGSSQASGRGLRVEGDFCTIWGLAVTSMPSEGIGMIYAQHCVIRSCHLGVNLAGTKAVPNGDSDLALHAAHYNTVGGTKRSQRNVVGAGGGPTHIGVEVAGGLGNTISGNYIGLRRDGTAALGSGGIGVELGPHGQGQAMDNRVGGDTALERNLFGGLEMGVHLSKADGNVIYGNYFGLAADGDTPLPIGYRCVWIESGCAANQIGHTRPIRRNVFAGGVMTTGVRLEGSGTYQNSIRGNYFGMNAAGTGRRRLDVGIEVGTGAGVQTIGGKDTAANYFTTVGDTGTGIIMSAGSGSLVQNNYFGVRPDGRGVKWMLAGLEISNASPRVLGNRFIGVETGMFVAGASASPAVYRNRFRRCEKAVVAYSGAQCHLGDLGNPDTTDDGGNIFRSISQWFIYNVTGNVMKAEGNDFGTTVAATIDAKIFGSVDYDPLKGGVIPTGSTEGVLALAGLAAVPSPAGAEVVFTLSSPAQVQARILNIAGRPIKRLCHGKECEAGTNTLVWNAQSDQGLVVPNGTYLVELTAKTGDGSQARALTPVRLNR